MENFLNTELMDLFCLDFAQTLVKNNKNHGKNNYFIDNLHY